MTNTTEAMSHTAQPADARSRRQFLRDTTLGAAGAVAAAQFPFVLTSHAATDDPIRMVK
jgi:hypothetical protein